VPSSSGEPTLRPSSSSIDRPPSPPKTPLCCRTPPASLKLTEASPPLKKHRRATPSTTSSVPDPLGEPRHHPSCPVNSPHYPHAHAAERAAWEPSARPSRPRQHGRGYCAVTTPGACAPHAGCHGPAGPLCRRARPTVLGLRLESRPSTVQRFF
jgi:hypothetical protein